FFVVKDTSNLQLYTRAGNFIMDRLGTLLSATGERVQGWTSLTADGNLDTTGAIGDIVVPVGSLKEPKVTKGFKEDLTLDSSAATGTSSDLPTPVTIYDSLGTAHVLTLKFEKTAANQWTYEVSIPGDEVSGGTAGSAFPLPGATGTLTFG